MQCPKLALQLTDFCLLAITSARTLQLVKAPFIACYLGTAREGAVYVRGDTIPYKAEGPSGTEVWRICTGLQSHGRQGYQRYKGPYLDQLRLPDLKTSPVSWIIALCGGSQAYWKHAYNVPEHAAMLQERLEENTVRYRVGVSSIVVCI